MHTVGTAPDLPLRQRQVPVPTQESIPYSCLCGDCTTRCLSARAACSRLSSRGVVEEDAEGNRDLSSNRTASGVNEPSGLGVLADLLLVGGRQLSRRRRRPGPLARDHRRDRPASDPRAGGIRDAAVRRHHQLGGSYGSLAAAMGVAKSTAQTEIRRRRDRLRDASAGRPGVGRRCARGFDRDRWALSQLVAAAG